MVRVASMPTQRAEASQPPVTSLSPEEQAVRDEVRRFAEGRLRALVGAMDREECLRSELVTELFDSGAMGIEIPVAYGGRGASFFSTMLAIEELARVDASVAVCLDVHNVLVAGTLLRWGSEAQRGRHLPALASRTLGAFALSERQAGSDAFAMTTRARPDAGGWLLDGAKMWTTNAAEAGLFVVFANARPERGAMGVSAFLVERKLPGVAVGPPIEKLGMRASSTCEVFLSDVRVGSDSLLGRVGAGQDIAMDALVRGRIGIAAQMVGLAEGAFDAALAYAQRRRQFGAAIASFQGVQFSLARMATDVEAARLFTYNSARLADAGASRVDLLRESAMAKYVAAQVAERVASQAVDVFGGLGVTRDCPAEKFYRDAKIGSIYEGTSNILLRTIASTLGTVER